MTRLALCVLALCAAVAVASPFEADDNTKLLMHLDGNTDNIGETFRVREVGNMQWAQGSEGQALQLDGKSGLHIWQHPALHIDNQSWTIQCAIKPDAEGIKQHAPFLSMGYGHGRILDLRIYDKKRIVFQVTAGAHNLVNVASDDISATLFDGNWHHVTAVIDRTRNGELRLYLDGKQINTDAGNMPHPIALHDRMLHATIGAGAPWYIATKGFIGGIDEVRFSNVVRKGFEAPADAPMPPAAQPAPIPAEAKLTATDAASVKPLTITADNLVVVMPRFAETPEHAAWSLLAPQIGEALGIDYRKIERRSDHKIGDTTGKAVIAVGNTAYVTEADLKGVERHGVRLMRKGNVIIITGGTHTAYQFAAREWLDRYLNVRFYMPGKLFTSKPKQGPITLGSIDVVSNPYVHVASSSGYHNTPESTPWRDLHALERRESSHQHNMWQRFPPERYAKSNPEIYPILKGKRYLPKNSQDNHWQPTFSEPSLVDVAVDSADRYFTENPDYQYIGFSVQDSHIHSEVDLETPEVKEHGKTLGLSILYWRFMNQVAERLEKIHPGKKIIGIVYAQVREAPPFDLHPNVVAWMVWKHSDNAIDKVFKPAGSDGPTRLQKWTKVASQLGHHDWAHGQGYLIPRTYPHEIQRTFLELEKRGAPLRYTHGEAYPNWGLDGPKLYLMARTWWDPHIDLDKELQQFCDDMFPGASKPMHDYFTRLEPLFQELNGDLERKLHRYWGQFEFTPAQRKTVAELRTLLDKAAAAASDDEARKRVELFSKTFHLTEMLIDLHATEPFDADKADVIRKYTASTIQPDPMTIYRRKWIADDLAKTLDSAIDQIERKAVYRKAWMKRVGK